MRQPTDAELKAIATLYQFPQSDREIQQSQQKALIQLGQALPVIHQVLYF